MRKVLSLLLCVAMLCSLVVFTAQADATPAADFADAVGVPGGSVTIDMKLANNPGIAALKFKIVEITEGTKLDATFAGADNESDTMGLTTNDAKSTYFWSGAYNVTNETLGTLTITIPAGAANGVYTFSVETSEVRNASNQVVATNDDTFTITVTDKAIAGVNVAIDAGLAIGVHVLAKNISGVSITAVDVDGKAFKTVTEHEDGEDGDYIFYLDVNPWDMDKEFTVDFTENFVIDEDTLDLDNLPGTAKTTGILDYCSKVLAGASDELTQLIADLLAYGQAAQTYQGVEDVMALPAGLTPTVGDWGEVEDPDTGEMVPATFSDYCIDNYTEKKIDDGNKTALKKFKFVSATVHLGAKFEVTFAVGPNGTNTGIGTARMKVAGGAAEELTSTGDYTGTYTYAFAPTQYEGIEFALYAHTSSFTNTNKCFTNKYGPSYYTTYLANQVDRAALNEAQEALAEPEGLEEDDIATYEEIVNEQLELQSVMDLLESFYNYSASVIDYVDSLGE